MLTLVLASAISAIAMPLALADVDDQRGGQRDEHHDKDRQKEKGHGDRDRHEYRQSNYYPQPVYVAPPVYYPPQQSPGISLFLPLDIHIR
jgi:Ni/Co efflux regulator RcnB